jgi:hypothetical protein
MALRRWSSSKDVLQTYPHNLRGCVGLAQLGHLNHTGHWLRLPQLGTFRARLRARSVIELSAIRTVIC